MSDLFAPPPPPKSELGRFRILSKTAGIRCSPLQLGSMSIGDAWEGFMGAMSKEQSFKLLDAYHENGGNFIDTANNYQDEQSETWIGEWMAERKNRDLMVIATKYTTPYRSYSQGKVNTINFSGNHKRSLLMSLRDSLKKLQTEWVDILYVHWWDWSTSIEEMMDSLDILVKQGKVLYLGISDTPAWIVSAANEYAKAHGKTQFSIYQGRWNIMLRDFERDIIPMARHYGMALAPWDAIGGGKFQSKKALEERKKGGEKLRSMMGGPEQTDDEAKMSEALCKVGEEHGIESPTAVALAYLISKTTNVFPIVGGRKVEHLEDNIKALSIQLTPKQIAYLEGQHPNDIGFPMNFVGTDPTTNGGQQGMILSATGNMAYAQGELPPQTEGKDKKQPS